MLCSFLKCHTKISATFVVGYYINEHDMVRMNSQIAYIALKKQASSTQITISRCSSHAEK